MGCVHTLACEAIASLALPPRAHGRVYTLAALRSVEPPLSSLPGQLVVGLSRSSQRRKQVLATQREQNRRTQKPDVFMIQALHHCNWATKQASFSRSQSPPVAQQEPWTALFLLDTVGDLTWGGSRAAISG